jgi:hypothetical protein
MIKTSLFYSLLGRGERDKGVERKKKADERKKNREKARGEFHIFILFIIHEPRFHDTRIIGKEKNWYSF